MEACTEKYCSTASLAAGEDPVGTATPTSLLLLLEVPTPWERELWKSPAFPAGLFDCCAAAIKQGLGLRLLCVEPDPEYSRADRRRLMVVRRPASPFARYDRQSYLLPDALMLPLVERLLGGGSLAEFALYTEALDGVRDLLVCTNGSVDAACGRFGVPVYEQLRREYALAVAGLRVWRVSHFGGHRFAPTVLDLPEMRVWAHLEPGVLDLLVHRSGEPAGLHRFYRGWAGLETPFEQAAERAALEQEGWDWLGFEKQGRVLQQSEDGTRAEVCLTFRTPGGQVGTYTATVEVSHRVTTVMASGRSPETAPQYRVSGLTRSGA